MSIHKILIIILIILISFRLGYSYRNNDNINPYTSKEYRNSYLLIVYKDLSKRKWNNANVIVESERVLVDSRNIKSVVPMEDIKTIQINNEIIRRD